MSNEHPLVTQVKIAAKRLKKSIPDKTLMQIQDIAAHALTGMSTFYELQISCGESLDTHVGIEESLDPIATAIQDMTDGLNIKSSFEHPIPINWGERNNVKPLFKLGNWHYYPDKEAIVLEGTKYSPYVVFLRHLETPASMLSIILHTQSKRFHLHQVKQLHESIPAFEVDQFISILQNIFTYYFDVTIQTFHHDNKGQKIDWSDAIQKKKKANMEEV